MSFKTNPKKYQPKGLTILFEDDTIIVVDKAPGLLTVGTDREKDNTAHALLNDYVKKGNPRSRNRVFVVHRLDRETSGLLVFAKSEAGKHFLQEHWASFSKYYFTVVHGQPLEKEGEIESYLFENKAFRVFSVKDEQKGKYSRTGYKVLKSSRDASLLEIHLHTGRKHQIRVHLAEKGHPVMGDKVYGKGEKGKQRLALHSASLKIVHPVTNKEMLFSTAIPKEFDRMFR